MTCRDQVGISWITPRSAQDRVDLAGISRRSTGIAVILPGAGLDQQVSRRDELRIEAILPGSGQDQQGSRLDQLRIEVILPGLGEDRRGLL